MVFAIPFHARAAFGGSVERPAGTALLRGLFVLFVLFVVAFGRRVSPPGSTIPRSELKRWQPAR